MQPGLMVRASQLPAHSPLGGLNPHDKADDLAELWDKPWLMYFKSLSHDDFGSLQMRQIKVAESPKSTSPQVHKSTSHPGSPVAQRCKGPRLLSWQPAMLEEILSHNQLSMALDPLVVSQFANWKTSAVSI